MEENKGKPSKYGRRPLPPLKKKMVKYAFRLDDSETTEFEKQYIASGAKTRTEFILAALFGRKITRVVVDMEKHEYILTLSNLQRQFRAIGINYNQVVTALNSNPNLSEKKVLSMLYKLEQHTLDLIRTNREILSLTNKMIEETSGDRKIDND